MKGIYKITSPTGKVYIGQSIDFATRFYTYKRLDKRSIGRVLYYSLLKHGFENHTTDIIHELPDDVKQDVINEYEKLYIAQYKSCGIDLMNLTDGGEGSIGYKHTPESIAIMKEKGKGRIAGSKNPNYGKGMHGKDNPMYGKKRPKEILDKLLDANQKPVIQYSITGEFIKEYKSVTDAAILNNLQVSAVSNVCLKRRMCKSSGGFIWRHKGDPYTFIRNRNFAPVLKYTCDGVFIKEYNTLSDALTELGKNINAGSLISSVCRGKINFAYGFKWEYKFTDKKQTA